MFQRWRSCNVFDLRKILAHDRNEIRIDYGRRCTLKFAVLGKYFVRNGNWKAGMPQGSNHELFVSRIRKREQQTKGNGICAALKDRAHDPVDLSRGRNHQDAPVSAYPLPQPQASLSRDEGFCILKQEIVKLRPRLPADFQNVFESGRRNQRYLASGSLKQRVRTDGSAADEL
jgi:hypothetical protein